MDMWTAIAKERRRLANDLDTLCPEEWSRSTACSEWDVKAVAAHLVLPFVVSKPRFALRALRNRRDIAKTVVQLTEKVNATSTSKEIIGRLRENADSRWKPPGSGAEVPLGEIVVHGQDIRRAVGIKEPVQSEIVEMLLASIDDHIIMTDYARRIGHQRTSAS